MWTSNKTLQSNQISSNPLENVVFIKAEIEDAEELVAAELACNAERHSHNSSDGLETELSKTLLNGALNVSKSAENKSLNNIRCETSDKKQDHLSNLERAVDDEGQWNCNICGLKYISEMKLLYHMKRKHSSFVDFQYACRYCGLEYFSKNGLHKHIRRKHINNSIDDTVPKEKFKCKYCDSQYSFKQSLYHHMKSKHLQSENIVQKYNCSFCDNSFTHKQYLDLHIENEHNLREKFICDHCNKEYYSKIDLKKHIQNIGKDDKDDETICSDFNENLKWWKDVDVGNGKKVCKFCDLALSNGNRLRYHIKSKHFNEYVDLKSKLSKVAVKKYPCVICGLRYKNKVCLRYHVKVKHNDQKNSEVKLKTCEFCGAMLKSSSSLHQHIKKKHQNVDSSILKLEKNPKFVYIEIESENKGTELEVQKRYPCDFCRDLFRSVKSLKHHKLAKHSNLPNDAYRCVDCAYRTKFKQYLKKHISLRHPESSLATPKKLHSCTICQYATLNKSHFERHLQTHLTKVKKFTCEFCDYKTNLQSSIIVHRRTHTKEKPYVCDVDGCLYRCAQKTAMNVHRLTHDPEKNMMFCNMCHFKTVNKYLLKSHINEHQFGKKRYKCNTSLPQFKY